MKKWIACLLAAPISLLAQSYTASVRGVVTDPSDKHVAAAGVTAQDVERGVQFRARTDEEGRYVFAALPPGSYTLEVEAAGFQKYGYGPFSLQVQQAATMNVRLSIQAVATAIDVLAIAPLLNMTSATLGQVVENQYIISLPLAGRNAMSLVTLSPGVTPSNIQPGGVSGDSTNWVANGTRNGTADVLVDGMSATNVNQNTGVQHLHYQPSVDVVQEFKMQTNFFSAEFGNTGGSVVNMVTRSGTNRLHGSAYEFHRNSALNANNFFSNRSGLSLPDFNRNVFGGTVGGPLRLPRVYDGRNRTFFFFNYEGERQENAVTRTATLPTLGERTGDFSDTRDAAGRLMTIFNPFDTYAASGGRTLRRAFPGNVVPLHLQSGVARKVMEFYPQPTSEGAAFTHTQNFFAQGVNKNSGNETAVKIDHNVSDRQRFTSRYTLKWGSGTPANLWGNVADNFINGDTRSRTQNFVLDWTRTQSASTLITVRYGLLRQSAHTTPQGLGFDPTSLGLPSIMLTSGTRTFPAFAPQNYQAVGTKSYAIIDRGDDVNSLTGSITKIFSGHNLKTGAEARLLRLNYLQPGYPAGQFAFGRGTTGEDPNRTNNLHGNAVASMLLGWGTGGAYDLDPASSSASQYYGWYAQDDWKVARRLTLNLGFRYDFEVPRTERYNRYTWFDYDAPSPIAGRVPQFPNLKGQFRTADKNVRSPMDGDYNNFQPRIGLAYALGDKTSVRSGYGMYYTASRATAKGHLGAGYRVGSPPQFSRDAGVTRYASLENPYPDGLNIDPLSAGAAAYLGLNFTTESRPNKNPQYQSWNFSIQRQLPAAGLLELAYTGSKGTHLYFAGLENINRLDPQHWGAGRTQLNRLVANPFYGVITDAKSRLSQPTVTANTLLTPYPQYAGNVSVSTPNVANSIYHAVSLKYEKRFSHGLAVLAHYTISKLITDTDLTNANVAFLGGDSDIQSFANLRLERGLSVMDIPQRFVLTFDYQLPVGRTLPKKAEVVLGGWEITGLMTLQSGFPIVPGLQGGQIWGATQRANLVGDPSVKGPASAKLTGYFNTEAFSMPAPDTYGTAPRTLNYRTPGFRNLDVALLKRVRLQEEKTLEFRLEAFNLTNTPIFDGPNATAFSPSFGVISGTANSPRQLQAAVKFRF